MAYCRYSERNLTPYSGNSARNLKSFFGDVFFARQGKRATAYCRYSERNLTPYSGNSARNLSTFFGDVFSQDKASKPPLYVHTARRKKRSFTGNSAPNLKSFFGDVFSQDKENKRRRTSVLQAKFDTVLRKNSPKNQISIMSASFFFAISSISLTYLSVIF